MLKPSKSNCCHAHMIWRCISSPVVRVLFLSVPSFFSDSKINIFIRLLFVLLLHDCRGVAGHPKHEWTSYSSFESVFKFFDEQYRKRTAVASGEVDGSFISFLMSTRSSAFAEGPRDASCQLKSCQLPRNSAETTCTSPEPSISCR